MQEEIEEMLQKFGEQMEKRFGAKNIASVVLSTETGEILTMVGSKDFFDNDIDGRVNIITSLRQPGSTFKPIAYAEAFRKGLNPKTVVYDVPTQFTSTCKKERFESTKSGCYAPINYTGKFKGPLSLREALAQSINIPAVKVLYLANIADVINLAKKMGITSLKKNPYHYGLSLVLGGGEVSPLDLAQVYSVFANEGIYIPNTWKLDENNGKSEKRVLEKQIAQDITDILSDNEARAPVFGRNSSLHITSPPVAAKTGTTNNARDIWVVGYSPDVVTLVWAGNADGTLLENNAAGAHLGPVFKQIMLMAAKKYGKQETYFTKNTVPPGLGPDILFGILDTENPHSILHYIQKNKPTQWARNPENDSQYEHWEYGVQEWVKQNEISEKNENETGVIKNFSIESPRSMIDLDKIITIIPTYLPIENVQYEFYVNNTLIGSSHLRMFSFDPREIIDRNEKEVTIRVIANTRQGVYTAEETYDIR